MMGRSHATSGALVAALIVHGFGIDDGVAAAGLVAVTTVGALLPDFDHDDAMLPRFFGPLGRLVAWTVGRVFGHRGITHSLLGLGLLTIVLSFAPMITPLPWWVSLGLLIGCAVHIVGDMLTVSGCPLFWPADRRFRLARFRTGSLFETAVLCPLMGLAAGAVLVLSLDGMTIPLS
jgi:inner membrane protein